MRLLVVEDDRDLNRQIVAALENAGYAVDRALDGEEGWFLGDTEPYDAIVLDIGLPKRDGVSVLTTWRKSGRLTPVLILTARAAARCCTSRLRATAGAARSRASTPGPTTTSPSRSTWRSFWRGCGRCSG